MLSSPQTGPGPVFADLPSVEQVLGFCVLYGAASCFGNWLMVIPGIEVTIWPPNGIVIAVLMSTRKHLWVWWILLAAVGELVANYLWFHNSLAAALGYVVANALEVLLAAYFLEPYFRGQNPSIGTLRKVFALLAIGVLAAPVVGATIGSTVSMLAGKDTFWSVWPLWWLGDGTGVLIAAPLVFSAIQSARIGKRVTLTQAVEAGLIGLSIVVLWTLVVAQQQAFAFAFFVPVLWAAVRFETTGIALAMVLLLFVVGYFSRADSVADNVSHFASQQATFQSLVLVLATTGYVVAAAVRQQRKAMEELAASNSRLEQRVRERLQEIEIAQRQFRTMFEGAAVGMSIIDPCGTIKRVNPNFAGMLGYRADEVENRWVDSFTHPEDLQKSEEARLLLQNEPERDSYVLEKRYVRKDGGIIWGLTSISCVRGPDSTITLFIKIIQDISARKELETTRQILMQEVNHRSKNLLSLIEAIARRTGADVPKSFQESFSRRLHALAANQDLLVRSSWESIQLEDLVRAQLAPFGVARETQFRLSGPAIQVSPRAAQGLGMAFHELATNAAKYGSLSTGVGRVDIRWGIDGDNFIISWREIDGPEVTRPPESSGFGTTVIDALIRSTLDAEVTIDFAASGLTWTCRCPAKELHM
jgi:PAS domain S-box-containing protein